MSGQVIMGVDPGVKTTAWAVIRGLSVLGVGVAKTKGGSIAEVVRQQVPFFETALKEWSPDLLVVEGQFYDRRNRTTPNDLIKLAQVAGGVLGQVMALSPCMGVVVPPSEWKGQTPKEIDQSRTYNHFGILSSVALGYAFPSGCKVISRVKGAGQLNRGDWEHVGDALGLARYAARVLS